MIKLLQTGDNQRPTMVTLYNQWDIDDVSDKSILDVSVPVNISTVECREKPYFFKYRDGFNIYARIHDASYTRIRTSGGVYTFDTTLKNKLKYVFPSFECSGWVKKLDTIYAGVTHKDADFALKPLTQNEQKIIDAFISRRISTIAGRYGRIRHMISEELKKSLEKEGIGEDFIAKELINIAKNGRRDQDKIEVLKIMARIQGSELEQEKAAAKELPGPSPMFLLFNGDTIQNNRRRLATGEELAEARDFANAIDVKCEEVHADTIEN